MIREVLLDTRKASADSALSPAGDRTAARVALIPPRSKMSSRAPSGLPCALPVLPHLLPYGGMGAPGPRRASARGAGQGGDSGRRAGTLRGQDGASRERAGVRCSAGPGPAIRPTAGQLPGE